MNISKKHIFATLAVIAALGLGYFKYQERYSRIYTEADDPIRFVSDTGDWSGVFQNIGPGADVVTFWYSPKVDRVFCEERTYFSEGERREITNFCPSIIDDLTAGLWVLTLDMYNRTNWREVYRKETGFD